MKRIFREIISRWAMAGLFIVMGIGLCWRALNYSSPKDTNMLAPVFCVILALMLAMTGLTMAMRGSDLEPEQTAAQQN
jgi:hypothetical protein